MITIIYNILGILMCIWYVAGYRWTMQGNELGKFIVDGFKLNWWFAPVNMVTAFGSAYFIIRALFVIDKSFTDNMLYWAIFLILRNCLYTVVDIADFIAEPTKKQFMFILIDIAMAVFVGMWMLKYRGYIV